MGDVGFTVYPGSSRSLSDSLVVSMSDVGLTASVSSSGSLSDSLVVPLSDVGLTVYPGSLSDSLVSDVGRYDGSSLQSQSNPLIRFTAT